LKNQWKEARKFFLKSLEYSRNNRAKNGLGFVHYKLGEYVQSLECFIETDSMSNAIRSYKKAK